MKNDSFKSRLIITLLSFSVCLTAMIGTMIGVYYKNTIMSTNSELAYSYAKAAADYIDGDRVAGYAESGQKDDYYYDVMRYLNAAQKNSNILYYYVFVPYEDDLVYIWDADNYEGACELGHHENYMEGGREASMRAMNGTPDAQMSLTDDGTYGYIGSVYYPIYNSQGQSVALVGVDLSVPSVNRDLFAFVSTVVIMTIAAIVVVVLALYAVISNSLIKPINQFNVAARNLVENLDDKTELKFVVNSSDAAEIRQLSSSFILMYGELNDYINKLKNITAEKERISTELKVATEIQADMLPCIFPAFPERMEFDIYASMQPAREVGGDFYDFFMVDSSHLAIVVADVSGKGVPAALFMVIGKTLIKDHTTPGADLGTVFTEVNNILCESNREGLFITAFEGVLDLATGEFRFVNAGHEMPFLARAGESFVPQKLRAGFVLAGMENMRYRAGSIMLEPGDRIFQYTDGVTEATNAQKELFGMKRLEAALNSNISEPPAGILSGVREALDAFVAGAPQFDDITMLCLEFKMKMDKGREE